MAEKGVFMKFFIFLTISLSLIACSKSNKPEITQSSQEVSSNKELENSTSQKEKNLKKISMDDLKNGECASLKLKNWDSAITIKYGVSGKFSHGFLRPDSDNNLKFSSLPKVDFKGAVVYKSPCPVREKTIKDIYTENFSKNIVYKGKNSDIKKVELGQCIHYDSSVGKVLAIKDNEVGVTVQSISYEPLQILEKSWMEKAAVITDCLNDMKVAYEEVNKGE